MNTEFTENFASWLDLRSRVVLVPKGFAPLWLENEWIEPVKMIKGMQLYRLTKAAEIELEKQFQEYSRTEDLPPPEERRRLVAENGMLTVEEIRAEYTGLKNPIAGYDYGDVHVLAHSVGVLLGEIDRLRSGPVISYLHDPPEEE